MDLLLVTRGLAAISVVIWHTTGYLNEMPPMLNVPGRVAVWLFFFGMSGYVIAYGFVRGRYALTKHDLVDFYVNRFLRIYPLFLLLCTVCWLTEFLTIGRSPFTLQEVPAQLLAFQFNHSYVLNGVFWTLGIEIQFYLIAPLLVLPMVKSTGKKLVFSLTGMYLALIYFLHHAVSHLGWSYDGRNIISNLPHFFVGMAACLLVAGIKPDIRRFRYSFVTVLLLLGSVNWLYNRHPERFWSLQGVVLVDVLIIFLVIAHASLVTSRATIKPYYSVLAFLGTLSYGIYAWHGYLIKYMPVDSALTPALLASSIVAAYLSFRFIESPMLRHKRIRH